MGKLITPFMYEDKLSGLAESFPLSLTDEVRQAITLPVCNAQPADSGPPAIGRFFRGTQQGALLAHKVTGWSGYVGKTAVWQPTQKMRKTVDFERAVSYVLMIVNSAPGARWVYWCAHNGDIYKTYKTAGLKHIPFRGQVMYFERKSITASQTLIVIGYY